MLLRSAKASVATLHEWVNTDASEAPPTTDASLLETILRTGLSKFVLADGRATDANITSETLPAVGLKVPWTGCAVISVKQRRE